MTLWWKSLCWQLKQTIRPANLPGASANGLTFRFVVEIVDFADDRQIR